MSPGPEEWGYSRETRAGYPPLALKKDARERGKWGVNGEGTAYLLSTYCMQGTFQVSSPLI